MRVRLLEREPVLCAHASGKNAAIFRQLDPEASWTALAVRTAAQLDAIDDRWVRRGGSVLVAVNESALEPLEVAARREEVHVTRRRPEDVDPLLVGGALTAG